jgi:TrmH family RNA methyltransferase
LAANPEFDRLCVVLVATRNPLNIGAAARAMSNFGFSTLRVVNPYEPSFREARSAVNAGHILASAEQFSCIADAIADCSLVVGTTAARNRELQHPLRPLNPAARQVSNHLQRGRAALLFGSEKTGLSNDDFSHCHWLLHIPTRHEHVSMNLGQAVAVCLYEIARELGLPGKTANSETANALATTAESDRLTRALMDALTASEYVKPGAEQITEEKVRRLILKLKLTEADTELLLGMVRQIVWKLNQ